MSAFFTIDTDNAIIRLYQGNATANGLKPDALKRLNRDLHTMAYGLTVAHGVDYRVEVVL